MSAIVVFGLCGVSTTARRFSSDQLCSASRRTLRAHTTPSSVLTRCSSVRSEPHSGFPSASQLRCRIPRSFSHLWKVSKHRFAELQQPSATRTTHGSIEWGLYIVYSEPMDEPSCMSNNPFHQCTVSGRSVLCSFLKRCQHRSHLSLQLFLIVFNSSVALMRSSWRTSDALDVWISHFLPT